MTVGRWVGSCLCLAVAVTAGAQDVGDIVHFGDRHALSAVAGDREGSKAVGAEILRSPVSDPVAEAFEGLLLNGTASDEASEIQLRLAGPAASWSPWMPVILKRFPNGRFWGRLDVPGSARTRVQVRIVDFGMAPDGRVAVFAVETRPGKRPERPPEVRPHPRQTKPESRKNTLPMPEIVTREDWGAQPPIGTPVGHDPYRMTQHHTAGFRIETLQDGMEEMRFIQDYHQNGRGWPDIGYHYCVDDAGRIYQGVSPDHRGTHTGGNNTGNIGTSLFGNFELAGEVPTGASVEALVDLWSWLALEYDISPDRLKGHRDYSATACPGEHLYGEIPEMRNQMRRTLEFGGPYLADPRPMPFSVGVDPGAGVAFHIRDAEEGVDRNSIAVRINGEPVVPIVSGTAEDFSVAYQPPDPFPASRTVLVEVEASDLAGMAHWMEDAYSFTIEAESLVLEVDDALGATNGVLELEGDWDSDAQDVPLDGLNPGLRLLAVDDDGSHVARLFPVVDRTGDFRLFVAVEGAFLGESAHYRLVNADGIERRRFIEYNGVFDGRWGALDGSPIHLAAGVQNAARIELSGIDGVETRLVADAFRLERVDSLDPPAAPDLKWVRRVPGAVRDVEVAWEPSLEGDVLGYRLFVSPDGRSWGQPAVDQGVLGPEATSHVFRAEDGIEAMSVRMVTVEADPAGTQDPVTSEFSDIYGLAFGSEARVLIVDNFDRRASWPEQAHAFVWSHGEAIWAQRVGFDACSETAVQTGEVDLSAYDAVFYFCGDDSRSDESLASADQQRLLEYLQRGGALFISGSEIGYDIAGSTPEEQDRIEYLLKMTYLGDHSQSYRVFGAAGTVFEGLNFDYGTLDSPETYLEDYPDYVAPAGGGQIALQYDNGRVAGVSYSGPYGAGRPDAHLVFVGFPFETINRPEDRIALIHRVLRFFGIPTQHASVGRGALE